MFDIFMLILWGIAGILTLTIKEIPKASYGIIWICFMTTLLCNCIE